MRYRIEYVGGCNYVSNRAELLKLLESLRKEQITDIRKIYANGISDSVLEKYQNYIDKIKRA